MGKYEQDQLNYPGLNDTVEKIIPGNTITRYISR
jgi:hypothetical protein